MIHLDTNYLIGIAAKDSLLVTSARCWMEGGEMLATSAVAWSEFLTGPVTREEIALMGSILQERIIPFGVAEAAKAAELFNASGRKRGARIDCFIAAAAFCAGASLATENRADFKPFVALGLRLM